MGKLWEMFHGQADMESTTALVASWGSIWQQEILQGTLCRLLCQHPSLKGLHGTQACPSLGTYDLRSSTCHFHRELFQTGHQHASMVTGMAGHLWDDLMNVSCQIAHSVNTRLVPDCIFCKHKAHVYFKSLNSPAPMQCPAHSKSLIFNKWMNQHQHIVSLLFNKWMNQHQWTCLGKCHTNQGSKYAC